MAGYVCTIGGGKGGVGKTTTAINLAVALQESGYDVVVVDADLGMANVGAALDVPAGPTIHEVLADECAVSDALVEVRGGLSVLPGESTLEAFADADPAALRTVIKTLRNAYDAVIVDTGSGLSHDVAVPLGLADGVVLVSTPDEVAIGDAVKTGDLAERLDGEVLGIVITRATGVDEIDAATDGLDLPLLGAVPEDSGATATEPLVLDSPDSAAADAYRRLATLLAGVFFEADDPAAADPVVDRRWFADDASDEDSEGGGGGRLGDLFG